MECNPNFNFENNPEMNIIKNKNFLFKFHNYKSVIDSINALEFAFYNARPDKIVKEKIHLSSSLTVFDINNCCKTFDLANVNSIYVISVGKASVKMLKAIYDICNVPIKRSILIMPKGQILDAQYFKKSFIEKEKITVIKSSHPIPDNNSLKASKKVIDLLKEAKRDDFIIFLISGGASSLIVSPLNTLNLQDKKTVNRYLLTCGANIREINIVRKHLSNIKGGNILKNMVDECCVISLILSDVIGDDLNTIGSGLTSFDESTFLDSRCIFDKYCLSNKDDISMKRALETITLGIKSKIPETLKHKDFMKKDVSNFIIGNNTGFCNLIVQYLKSLGYEMTYLCLNYDNQILKFIDESKKIVKDFLKKNSCVLIGGEITNTITKKNIGKGGRNQESLCHLLDFFCNCQNEDYSVIFIGTDGIDGNSKAAGGLISPKTIDVLKKRHIDICDYLNRHDSFNLLSQLHSSIYTGYTGTNFNDVYLFVRK
jgi:glycerate 2-kinase